MLRPTDARNTLYSSFCHCIFYITFEVSLCIFIVVFCILFNYVVLTFSAYFTWTPTRLLQLVRRKRLNYSYNSEIERFEDEWMGSLQHIDSTIYIQIASFSFMGATKYHFHYWLIWESVLFIVYIIFLSISISIVCFLQTKTHKVSVYFQRKCPKLLTAFIFILNSWELGVSGFFSFLRIIRQQHGGIITSIL